jgi:hypothetical protein
MHQVLYIQQLIRLRVILNIRNLFINGGSLTVWKFMQ